MKHQRSPAVRASWVSVPNEDEGVEGNGVVSRKAVVFTDPVTGLCLHSKIGYACPKAVPALMPQAIERKTAPKHLWLRN